MTKPSVHLALATLRDVLEAFEEKKRQRQKNKSGKEKDLSKVLHVFATTLGGVLYTEEPKDSSSGQAGAADMWSPRKNIPRVLEEAGKLRAELVGTTRQALAATGDAPGRSDLRFLKSPLDLRVLLENGGGDDGNNNSVLFLQHLADRQGNTLLHWAMERMDTSCDWLHNDDDGWGSLLLRLCPGANAKNARGITPLHFAAGRNCPSCVRALLRRGADALAQGDSCFETPAFLSVMACAYKWAPGCLDTFRILVEEGGAEKKDILAVRNSAGETLAHAAACHAKDGGVLRYLLELDPSLAHATDEDGETPLHCAARRFNREAIEALTAVDPKLINKKNDMGSVPLMDVFCEEDETAAFPSDLASRLRFLLSLGADASARDGLGRTALHYALMLRGPSAAAAAVGRAAEREEDRRLGECLGVLLEGGADPRWAGWGDRIGEGEALTPAELADRYYLFDIASKLRAAAKRRKRTTSKVPPSVDSSANDKENKEEEEAMSVKRIAEEVIRKKIEELWN